MAPPLTSATTGPEVVAAGAVVTRKGPEGREVLLVHRPKYDDWSFPKGKQEPGEHVATTAVREVLEETGVEIRLGRPLRPQGYHVSGGRAKTVHYWAGHAVGDDDVSSFVTNEEVDDLGWFSADSAAERLTYLDDISLLEQYRERRKTTSTLVVVRHAKAHKRGSWSGPDPKRPLSEVGELQARALSPLLHAYGISRLLSSSSTRCSQTVRPYAEDQLLPVVEVVALSEEGYEEAVVRDLVGELLETAGPSVLCTHRPILPRVLAQLGITEEPLSPAELIVCHHRRGSVVASERHQVRPEVP